MNREGKVPPDLGEIVEIETKPVKILDYENVVGQDSLTRLDERSRNKKKNKNRNKNNRPNGNADNNMARPGINTQQGPQQPRPQGNRPLNNNNRDRNFRPNGNNQNRPNPGNPDRRNEGPGNQPDKPQ